MKTGDTTNQLMRHIRKAEGHNAISGSVDKINLKLMGYFHGYKGCKYVVIRHLKQNKKVSKKYHNRRTGKVYKKHPWYISLRKKMLPLHRFRKIKYIYDTDKRLRFLFYPIVMQLEIALKNYTIETVTSYGGIYLNSIFNKCMNNYINTSNYYKLKKSFQLRSTLEQAISHSHNKILLDHYRKKNKNIPLWAIFQMITLGQFSFFLSCMNKRTRKELETNIYGKNYLYSYHKNYYDMNYYLLSNHVNILKNLRNAISHNDIIFDCRFMESDVVSKKICKQLENEFNINKMTFRYISDYLVLMIFYQFHLHVQKNIMKREIRALINILKDFQYHESPQIYNICFNPTAIPKLKKVLTVI